MAPKRKAAELSEPFLDDSGRLLCQVQKDFLVTIGVNLAKKQKQVVRVRVGEAPEEAVRRWLRTNVEKAQEMMGEAGPATRSSDADELPDVDDSMFTPMESFLLDVEGETRDARARRPPDRLHATSKLRKQAVGRRHESGQAGPCQRRECRELAAKMAAEREWVTARAAVVRASWQRLQTIALEASRGDEIVGTAVCALQEALLVLLDDEMELSEQSQGVEGVEGADSAEEGSGEEGSDEGEEESPDFQLSCARGTLQLRTQQSQLRWKQTGGDGVQVGVCDLHSILKASTEVVRVSPFERVVRLAVHFRDEAAVATFDSPVASTEAVADFCNALQHAISVAEAASASASTSSQSEAKKASKSDEKVSKRVRLGRELRSKMLQLVRLRHNHKGKEADEMVCALEVETAEAAERAQKSGLTKKRAAELRDTAFSFGSLQLTRDIVAHFMGMPEVRELLRGQDLCAQAASVDKLIVQSAKDFCRAIFQANGRKPGTGGRLNDDARNAQLAALATLLPRTLFENRNGRAACRALGISYRQAKRGIQVRGELLDSATGWKRIKTAEHRDKVDYLAFLDEAWHSELLSTPDNQNKHRIRVDLGTDPQTGEKLYDIHDRRAQLASTKQLLAVFRNSEYAARLREATKTSTRPNGVKVGIKQFTEARCPCIKVRKPSQCDCEQCTYVIENLYKFNIARANWHAAHKRSVGFRCQCFIHRALTLAELVEADLERAWHEAGCGASEDREDLRLAAEEALARTTELAPHVERARAYDSMTKSPERLMEALLPCGRTEYPNYSVTGARTYSAFSQKCASGNCPQKLWRGAKACNFEALFKSGCPLERHATFECEWKVWEPRPRGKNRETGEVSYSTEFVPRRGTREQFFVEFTKAIPAWIYHVWRDDFIKQGLRVFEDRKSGRHLDACHQRADDAVGTRGAVVAARELERARQMYEALQRTATVQSDYAAQLEVVRSHSATCARPAKHNLLVSIVGYKSYKKDASLTIRKRRKLAVPSRRVSSSEVLVKRRRECQVRIRSERHLPQRFTSVRPHPLLHPPQAAAYSEKQCVYLQHVDYMFAFHDSSYKPNARSYNVAQEDLDHFLKYGTVLYGEWFVDGQRVPLRDGKHTTALPNGLTERPQQPPDFPEFEMRHSVHDGCTSQFACGTEFHQTAEWRSKTAEWSSTDGQSLQCKGIIRDDIKLVEHHGKGPYDAAGNIPNAGVRASVKAGLTLQPGTRDLVLHLAAFYSRPTVSKSTSKEPGWLAADRYIYCFYDTSKFTRFTVPESKGFSGSHSHHHFVGLCVDRAKAERDGPVHARHMFCSCYACIMHKFDECEMQAQVGKMRVHSCPLLSSSQLRRPLMRSLQDFADDLCTGMVVATRVAQDQRRLEFGRPYWLARVLSPAFAAPSDMLYAGCEIEEGSLVVEVQWYELQDEERHGYKLNPEKVILVVNTIVRLKGIRFDANATGVRVSLRSGRGQGQMECLSEDMHYAILQGVGEE